MFAPDYIFRRSDFGHFFRLEFERAVSSDAHTFVTTVYLSIIVKWVAIKFELTSLKQIELKQYTEFRVKILFVFPRERRYNKELKKLWERR